MDGMIDFIVEQAAAARACELYELAADWYMMAVARTLSREYLRQANECRARALGVLR